MSVRRGLAAVALAVGCAAGGPLGAADLAVVTSQGAGALSLLDPGAGTVLATVPLPGKPAAVAVDAARGRILVVAVETATLHVLDLQGRPLRTLALDGAPFGVAISPVTGLAYVSDWEGTAVAELDPGAGTRLRRLPTGAAPSGLVVSDDGATLVTADRDADQLSLIDLATGQARSVAVGRHPFGVTLRDGRAFAANVLGDSVSVVDLATARVIGTIPVGARPYAIAFAGGEGFVTNQYGSSVTVFDAATLEVRDTIAVGDYPEGIAPMSDGRHLVLANWFSDSVMVIDAASRAILHEIPMPEGPRAFGSFVIRLPGGG